MQNNKQLWMELDTLIGSSWMRFDEYHMSCLLRRNIKTLISSGERHTVLELARIQVDTKHQSKGNFKRFLASVEKYCAQHDLLLYVENVMARGMNGKSEYRRFINFFAKRGYLVDYEDEEATSYFYYARC